MSEPAQESTGPEAALIVLTRPHYAWVDRFRSYKVVVDGMATGDKVRNGETIRLSLAPGTHDVALRIDWSGSKPLAVTLRPGEVRRLTVEHSGNVLSTEGYLRLVDQE